MINQALAKQNCIKYYSEEILKIDEIIQNLSEKGSMKYTFNVKDITKKAFISEVKTFLVSYYQDQGFSVTELSDYYHFTIALYG